MSPPEPLPEPTTPSDSPPLGPTEAGQASAAAALQPAPPRVDQRVAGDGNQVIGDMQGGTAIGNVETLILNPPAPPIAPPLETYFGVPYQRNRFFTGRVEILNRLQQQLHQDGAVAINQIQAIRGLGGMGKTQTAVEYAYRSYESAPRPYDWVLWVRADTEANLISDFAGLATQLRLPAAHLKPEEQIPAVQQWLATRDRWLLIFDNADTPEWLQPFLSGRYQGCVLLTSRADVFDQVGIANPLSLDVLTDQEAVDFLFQRVGRDRTAPEEQAAIELATELGNLPLALEQAGAFIVRQRLSFQTYLSTYRKRRLQQLEKVKPQTGKYPASVLTTWSLNFQAVETANAASAEVLRLSAVVAPDAIPYRLLLQGAAHLGDQLALSLQAEEEAEAVMAVSELLTPLSQYSLIQWEPEQAQYSMHRMVQAVVQDGLTQDTQQLWVTRAVNALAATFPAVEFQTWAVCAQLLPHALKVMEQANAQGDGSEAFARLLNQTASYLQDQGRYDAAEPLYRDALQLYRELLGDSPAETLRERQLDVATSLNNLAYLYDSQGRYDDAESLFRDALQLRRELLGERHPAVATSLNNLAGLYDSQGRYDDAEPLYHQALDLRRELLGERHPAVATSLNNLAGLYESQGRYTAAEPLYHQALALRRELLRERHPDVASSLNNLAGLYESQGRYDDAEPLYRDALQLYRELLGERHPLVATSLNNLAGLYESQGRYDDAEPLYQQALELSRELLGDRHPQVALSLNNLARLYQAQGRYDTAEPLYLEALAILAEAVGTDHPNVQTVLSNFVAFLRGVVEANQTDQLSAHPLVKHLLAQMGVA